MYTTLSYGHYSYIKIKNLPSQFRIKILQNLTNYIKFKNKQIIFEEDENVFKFKYILYLRYEELFQEPLRII